MRGGARIEILRVNSTSVWFPKKCSSSFQNSKSILANQKKIN